MHCIRRESSSPVHHDQSLLPSGSIGSPLALSISLLLIAMIFFIAVTFQNWFHHSTLLDQVSFSQTEKASRIFRAVLKRVQNFSV